MNVSPPVWTKEQLDAEVDKACEIFRHARLNEPLEKWKEIFDTSKSQFNDLFEIYGIADPTKLTPANLALIYENKLGDALRYLAGPPISADDLRVLAEATLSAKSLSAKPTSAKRVLDTIIQAVDPRRFPWIAENRDPTEVEKSAAILASAALITAQLASTHRRNQSKKDQEQLVKDFLLSRGFKEVPTKEISNIGDAPKRGEFCGETKVGTRKADIPVRLYDGRLMPIECKVSNSKLNSVKRVNNDAAMKATSWNREFGTSNVVPAAVLSGVFKTSNLLQAQNTGLTIFWAHQMEKMWEFIDSARK